MPLEQRAHLLIDKLPKEKLPEAVDFLEFIAISKPPVPDFDAMSEEELAQMLQETYDKAMQSGNVRPAEKVIAELREEYAF